MAGATVAGLPDERIALLKSGTTGHMWKEIEMLPALSPNAVTWVASPPNPQCFFGPREKLVSGQISRNYMVALYSLLRRLSSPTYT